MNIFLWILLVAIVVIVFIGGVFLIAFAMDENEKTKKANVEYIRNMAKRIKELEDRCQK